MTDSLGDGHRSGGHRHFAGGVECTGNDDALAAEAQDGYIDLRTVDVVGQATRNQGAQFFNGLARGFDVADVRVEQGAIGAYQTTVGIQLLLRAGRRGQLRVVPDGNVEQVVGADAVGAGLVVEQFLLAGGARVGGEVTLEHFGGDADQLNGAVLGFGAFLELIGIEVLAGGERTALQYQGGSKS